MRTRQVKVHDFLHIPPSHSHCVKKKLKNKQTQSNRVCCFQTVDTVLSKDLISDYLEIATAVFVLCGDPK